MNSSWNIAQLGDIYEFSSGLSKSRSEFGSGYPFLGFKDVFYNSAIPNKLEELVQSNEKEQKKCSIKRGDVFLTRTSETMNELGMSCVALQDVPFATFNGFSKRLRPIRQDSVVPEYARYYFRSNIFRQKVNSMATMSTRASLNNEILQRLEIILPPKNDQKIIGHILGTFDEKIELNKKTNKNLEDIAKGLFKSWFIDFDPVKAKSEGRSTGLPNKISDLFPDSFEDSELGEIPRGWEIRPLRNLIDFQNGYAFKSNNWKDSGIPVVKIGSVKPGIVDLSNVSYVDEEIANSCEEFRLSPGDILIGMTGYVGEVGLVPRGNIAPLLNQRVGKLIPKNIHYKSFIFCLARSNAFRKKVEELSSGSAQANISSMNICNIQLVKPNQKVLEAFAKIVDNHLESYLTIHKESGILSNLRDVILPKLISGELRIPDAEQMIEEVGI